MEEEAEEWKLQVDKEGHILLIRVCTSEFVILITGMYRNK
jgi:hypothetical protein